MGAFSEGAFVVAALRLSHEERARLGEFIQALARAKDLPHGAGPQLGHPAEAGALRQDARQGPLKH